MRSLRAVERTLSLAMLLVLASLAPTAAAGPQTQIDRFVLGDGLSVAAPAPGYGIVASAITSSGDDLGLVLETDANGVTRVVPDDVAMAAVSAPSGATLAGGAGACGDGAYHLLGIKWKTTWNWWFASPTTPGEITRAAAEGRLRSAVASITGERNDCGRPDTVSATSRYRGRTRTRPDINGGCLQPSDHKSVVGFGTLPPNVLGLTCTTYELGTGVQRAVESDVLFNKRSFDWATSRAGCTNAALLRSIATHEFGHVYGLNHVTEGSHPNLTMSESIGACDDSAFTLGLGDMRGLERRYPLPND